MSSSTEGDALTAYVATVTVAFGLTNDSDHARQLAGALMEIGEVVTVRVTGISAVYRIDVAGTSPEAVVPVAVSAVERAAAQLGVTYVVLGVDVEQEDGSAPFTGRSVIHRSPE